MDSFWVKIAVFGLIGVGLVVLVNKIHLPKMETKNVYDINAERAKRLRQEPEPIESVEQTKPADQQAATAAEANQPVVETVPAPAETQAAAPKFRQLSEEEELEAEMLFEKAMPFAHIGHLPMMGYKTMVDTCRQIIQKFPDSEYAWKAKRMLKDMPERYREAYHITPEEIDLGNYK